MSRCLKLVLTVAFVSLVAVGTAYCSETPDFEELSAKDIGTVKKGLKYISQNQSPDGGFTPGPRIAVTAVAGMAFLANGNTPGEGKYAKQVLRAVRYIVKKTDPRGFISESGSRMYEHGFATLFLAEAYGMCRSEKDNKEIKQALTRSMALLSHSQGSAGGWDYNPAKGRSDISVTVCQTMGMRAARAAGVPVSPDTVKNAIDCMNKAYCKGGGFSYTSPGGSGPRDGTSAGGACILYALGLHASKEVTSTLDYIVKNHQPWKRRPRWYFYTSYYSTYAMYQKGGKYWKEWFPHMKRDLINKQQPNGAWQDTDSGGNTYSTAVSCLILQIPFRYLPIVQR